MLTAANGWGLGDRPDKRWWSQRETGFVKTTLQDEIQHQHDLGDFGE